MLSHGLRYHSFAFFSLYGPPCGLWNLSSQCVSAKSFRLSDSVRPYGLCSHFRLLCLVLRQECWSGMPCPPRGIFPTQWSNPVLLHCRADSLSFEPPGNTRILEWVSPSPGSSKPELVVTQLVKNRPAMQRPEFDFWVGKTSRRIGYPFQYGRSFPEWLRYPEVPTISNEKSAINLIGVALHDKYFFFYSL